MRGGRALAALASAVCFTAHHTLALAAQAGPVLVVVGSLAVLAAGATWSWLYLRYRSVWVPWLAHVLADLPIFAIGWHLLFGRQSGSGDGCRLTTGSTLGDAPRAHGPLESPVLVWGVGLIADHRPPGRAAAHGLIMIGVPSGTRRQISSISSLVTAMHPSVQSRRRWLAPSQP